MTLPLLTLLLAAQAANPVRLLASTSDAVGMSSARPASEAAILVRDAGSAAQPWVPDRAWEALLGDLDADGIPDLPAGVDAMFLAAPRPGAVPSVADLRFSTNRNGPGYRDGDVLQLTAVGTLAVVHPESDLDAQLAPTSGTVDIDAMTPAPNGGLLLSLRDSLPGTVLGDLQDGSVFGWDPASGALWMVADEQQVQAWVAHATGSSAAIGDLKSLAYDAQTGEMLFTVQAPGDRDGTVFGDAGGGRVVAGWEEQAWGLAGPFELDALAIASPHVGVPPVLDCPSRTVSGGEILRLNFRSGVVDEGVVMLVASQPSWSWPGVAGFGLQIGDRFAPPVLALPLPAHGPLRTGALGSADYDFRMPAIPLQLLGRDLLVQAAGGRSGLSTPLRWSVQ